jgi:hypothetical protein
MDRPDSHSGSGRESGSESGVHDFSRDEVRRQLRASQREHAEQMPKMRSMLARVFDRDSRVPVDDKARLVGVDVPPASTGRRALLGGGLTLAGMAVVAACTPAPSKDQLAQTGTVPNPSTPATLSPEKAAELMATTDLTLLRTAQSLEALAVVTYGLAIGSGKVTTSAVADAAKLFQSQHTDHEGALSAQIRSLGGQPYTNPDAGPPPGGVDASQWSQVNPALWKSAVQPVVSNADALSEAAILKLALLLENTAAQTYTKAGSTLSTPPLRSFIMSIGGTEARHAAVINGVLAPDDPRQQVPVAFMQISLAVDPDDYVGPGDMANVTIRTTTTTAKSATTLAKSTGSAGSAGSGGSGASGTTAAP